jgi:hypothetical protein
MMFISFRGGGNMKRLTIFFLAFAIMISVNDFMIFDL